VTEVRSASAHLFAGKWRPWWVLLQHYYVAIIFHRQVWYGALSLCYACIQHSGIIFTPRLPLCLIQFLLRAPLLS